MVTPQHPPPPPPHPDNSVMRGEKRNLKKKKKLLDADLKQFKTFAGKRIGDKLCIFGKTNQNKTVKILTGNES